MPRKLTYSDEEGGMVKAQLLKIETYAKKLNDMIHPEDELEAWVQSKISVVAAYMGDVKHYLDYELKKFEEGGSVGTGMNRYKVEFTWSDSDDTTRTDKVVADNVEEASRKIKLKFSPYYKGFEIIEVELDEDEEFDVVKEGKKVGSIVASDIEVARKKASEWYGIGYEVLQEDEEDEEDEENLSFKNVLDKTTFSEGLKEDLIKDFKYSGFKDFSKLKGSNVKETENNILKKVFGFSSGKNTYLQAKAMADAIHNMYYADGGDIDEREKNIVEILIDKKYPLNTKEYRELSEETGYKVGDIIYVHQKMNDDIQYNVNYSKGGKIIENSDNTEVIVGNWKFYFNGLGDDAKLSEIYHKPTDLEASWDKREIIYLGNLKEGKTSRLRLLFTHPTMGVFQLRDGFEILKERPVYVDGSIYAKGGKLRKFYLGGNIDSSDIAEAEAWLGSDKWQLLSEEDKLKTTEMLKFKGYIGVSEFESISSIQYKHGGKIEKTIVLIISEINPLSRQLIKLEGTSDWDDIYNSESVKLIKSNGNKYIVFTKRYISQVDKKVILDGIDYIKKNYKIENIEWLNPSEKKLALS